MGYLARQAVLGALAAVALRPLPGPRAGIASFAVGLPVGELAPQLLGLSLLDTTQHAVRGRFRTRDVVVGAATTAALGALVRTSYGAGRLVEDSLTAGVGSDDLPALTGSPIAWRQLARPFRSALPEVERIADISYADAPEGASRARLDVFRPRAGITGAPVLVQVHGGAWVLGNKEEQGQLLLNRMASLGWVGVAANYRLAPKHRWPTQVVDVKRVLAWVREHISEYGGDPSYVVITGGSAGGHLAALAALTPGDPAFQPGFGDADTSVAACVPFYGVYDLAGLTGTRAAVGMRDGFLGRRVFPAPYDEDPDAYVQASPLARINPDAPDFFCLHGTKDSVVPVAQARAFVERLRATSDATVTYAELPGAQHAFEIFSSLRSQAAITAVSRWLQWHRTTHAPAGSAP